MDAGRSVGVLPVMVEFGFVDPCIHMAAGDTCLAYDFFCGHTGEVHYEHFFPEVVGVQLVHRKITSENKMDSCESEVIILQRNAYGLFTYDDMG